MVIREYQTLDCKVLAELFYNTVHTVNAKDYTKEQLDAWATGTVDLEKWNPDCLSIQIIREKGSLPPFVIS